MGHTLGGHMARNKQNRRRGIQNLPQQSGEGQVAGAFFTVSFICFIMGIIKLVSGAGTCATTDSGTAPEGTPCAFPFTYEGVAYSACTNADNLGGDGEPWCMTEANATLWGNCNGACNKDTAAGFGLLVPFSLIVLHACYKHIKSRRSGDTAAKVAAESPTGGGVS